MRFFLKKMELLRKWHIRHFWQLRKLVLNKSREENIFPISANNLNNNTILKSIKQKSPLPLNHEKQGC